MESAPTIVILAVRCDFRTVVGRDAHIPPQRITRHFFLLVV